ncbi:src kinase-associated phosphoprotein 1 [Lates japonicus]|uniref:Src kinase-associated phosphoprotein 1 n=1 Tax=Lates japonicus TaxID=270547 RepID=A0AAD3MTB6_LATJO|nr:src kinase-associated phosphoprotein 1 [Lates japonicus]
MGTIPHDIRRLLNDCELFVTEILQDKDLSESAQEARKVLLNNFRVVHVRNPQEFPFPSDYREEDDSDDNRSSSLGLSSAPSDDASVASDYQDEGGPEFAARKPRKTHTHSRYEAGAGSVHRCDCLPSGFKSSHYSPRATVLLQMLMNQQHSPSAPSGAGSLSLPSVSPHQQEFRWRFFEDIASCGCSGPANILLATEKNEKWPGRRNETCLHLSERSCLAYSKCPVGHWIYGKSLSPASSLVMTRRRRKRETYDDIEGVTGSPYWARCKARPLRAPSTEESRDGSTDEEDEDIYEVLPEEDFPDVVDDNSEKNNKPAWSSDYANYYQGLWDCQADEPDELTFQRGDLIHVISKEYNIYGWWVGELNGTVGIVPKDFLHPAYIL